MMVEQWNSVGGTVWCNSGTVMVEECGGTVMVDWCWWNSGTVLVEQWNSDRGTVWWNSLGGTVWCNSGTVMLEECGGTVKQ